MKKDVKDILERVASGHFDQQDEEIAKRWLFDLHNTGLDQHTEDELKATSEEIWSQVQKESVPVRRMTLWSRIASIAAVILILGVAGYIIYQYQQAVQPAEIQVAEIETILPGGNRAYLTTESGEVITLSTDQSGLIIGEEILYADGSIVEGIEAGSKLVQRLTMTVPKAGIYQVQLPDGSKVWLNSVSKLTYPSSFIGEERIVELEGEAYFEIAKDSKRPFRVYSKGQEIEVLGTQFNVNSYAEEQHTTTTLLEGSVKVKATASGKDVILEPGEQATLQDNQQFSISQVNKEEAIAWKNGLFIFNDQKLEHIMEQVARWYDIEVVYEKKIPSVVLGGVMSRKEPLDRLLSILERAGKVKFTIEKNKIIVNQQKIK